MSQSEEMGSNRTQQPGNDSQEESDDETHIPTFSAQADIVGILLALLIVVFNTLVFILITKKRSLRTTTNYFLIGLAASDLLTGLTSLPVAITCNIYQENWVCFSTIYIWMFTSFLTLSHILAVTADRFIAIMFSLRYTQIVTKRRCIFALCCVWSSSLAFSLLQFWWQKPTDFDPNERLAQKYKSKEFAFNVACFVIYLAMPVVFMTITYSVIFSEIRRQNRRQNLNVPADLQAQCRRRKREWKAITIFLAMFFTYILSWLPFFLLRYEQNEENLNLPDWAMYVLGYARFVSSLLNPCIYIFGKHDFRKAWETLLSFKHSQRDRGRSDLIMIMSSQV